MQMGLTHIYLPRGAVTILKRNQDALRVKGGNDHVARETPIELVLRGRHVKPNALNVPVGNGEMGKGTDHHVGVERIDVRAEHPLLDTSRDDRSKRVDRGRVQFPDSAGMRDVLRSMDVLDLHETDEVLM